MSRQLKITEEIHCDICGNTIYGNHRLCRSGHMFLQDCKEVNYTFDLKLNNFDGRDCMEHICKDCLKDFLERLASNLRD